MPLDDTAHAERARLNLARPDLLRERAFIGGEWIDGAERIRVTNPATRGVLGHIPESGQVTRVRFDAVSY